MVRFDGCWIVVALLFQCVIKSGAESIDASVKCERLKASLTYPQEKAPSDLSAVVRSAIFLAQDQILECLVVLHSSHIFIRLVHTFLYSLCPFHHVYIMLPL